MAGLLVPSWVAQERADRAPREAIRSVRAVLFGAPAEAAAGRARLAAVRPALARRFQELVGDEGPRDGHAVAHAFLAPPLEIAIRVALEPTPSEDLRDLLEAALVNTATGLLASGAGRGSLERATHEVLRLTQLELVAHALATG